MVPIHQMLEISSNKNGWCQSLLQLLPPAGDRSKLKMLANQEPNVDCLDTAGHTPLMYAVIGKQTKVRIPYE